MLAAILTPKRPKSRGKSEGPLSSDGSSNGAPASVVRGSFIEWALNHFELRRRRRARSRFRRTAPQDSSGKHIGRKTLRGGPHSSSRLSTTSSFADDVEPNQDSVRGTLMVGQLQHAESKTNREKSIFPPRSPAAGEGRNSTRMRGNEMRRLPKAFHISYKSATVLWKQYIAGDGAWQYVARPDRMTW